MPNTGFDDPVLCQVARVFRDSLARSESPHSEVVLSRIDGLDRIGIPVVQAAVLGDGGQVTAGYGYGTTEIEAQVGALGELCEEVHAGAWLARAPRRAASHAALVRACGPGAALDPLTLCLAAGSDYTPDQELSWVEGRHWPSGEAVLVPAEWVAAHAYQLAEPALLITPITNGLGAGLDLHHALAHGVMELLQRDGNVVSFRALDQGVVIDLPCGLLPEIDGLVARLHAQGISPLFKLAATDMGFANLYVVGDDTGQPDFALQISACGEASHPDSARALRKALLEFVGSRSRKAATHGPVERARAVLPGGFLAQHDTGSKAEERRALDAMAGWLALSPDALRSRLAGTLFAQSRHIGFAELATVPSRVVASSQDRLDLLAQRLADAGLGIVYVDCSPPGGGVRVVRAIVPGLETETMSYGRIGWRGVARLRARGDRLILDGPRAGAGRVRLRAEDEDRAGGPAWFDAAYARTLTDPLYPLYRECGPFAAQRRLHELAQRAAPALAPAHKDEW